MYFKVHRSYRTVVAVCDADLIGRKLEEGKQQLEVSERFFKDQSVREDELVILLHRYYREDATFNIVGLRSVGAAVKAGIVDNDGIGHINGIPFVLIL